MSRPPKPVGQAGPGRVLVITETCQGAQAWHESVVEMPSGWNLGTLREELSKLQGWRAFGMIEAWELSPSGVKRNRQSIGDPVNAALG